MMEQQYNGKNIIMEKHYNGKHYNGKNIIMEKQHVGNII